MRALEEHCEWTAGDLRDPALWTEVLTKPELEDIDAALRLARSKSDNLLEIGAADFPLPHVHARIARIKHELVLQGRAAYQDRPGKVRHLKRLWLETDAYETRPPCFVNNVSSSWNEKRVISRLDAARAN
jgi:hypothetical protein